jgi:cardiolipin synthase A/B
MSHGDRHLGRSSPRALPRQPRWPLVAVAILGLAVGCATLPNVSETMKAAPAAEQRPPIVSARGLLSPERSKAIMERLQRSSEPTDLLARLAAVTESVSETPLTRGNKVTLLVDGPATYAAMFEAMKQAREHINLESFIIDDDEAGRRFSELLVRKRAKGVQVNLIYDSVGSSSTSAPFFERLRSAGVQVVEFNRINPLKAHGKWGVIQRDHRKILIIDGKIAFAGGVNISQAYSSGRSGSGGVGGAPVALRDTDVRVEGPAVAELQRLFLDTWQAQKGPALPARAYFPELKEAGKDLVQVLGSTPGRTNRITFVMYVAAITFAKHSVHLTTAYFIPDDQVLKAFTDAARRGVDVKLLLPSTTDSQLALHAQRYNYSELLKAGVRVYELRKAMLHAKTAVIDDVWSTVGSSNMDYLSFLSNDEVNVVIVDPEFAAQMETMFARDLAAADEIQRDGWKRRTLLSRVEEGIAHLLLRWL